MLHHNGISYWCTIDVSACRAVSWNEDVTTVCKNLRADVYLAEVKTNIFVQIIIIHAKTQADRIGRAASSVHLKLGCAAGSAAVWTAAVAAFKQMVLRVEMPQVEVVQTRELGACIVSTHKELGLRIPSTIGIAGTVWAMKTLTECHCICINVLSLIPWGYLGDGYSVDVRLCQALEVPGETIRSVVLQ